LDVCIQFSILSTVYLPGFLYSTSYLCFSGGGSRYKLHHPDDGHQRGREVHIRHDCHSGGILPLSSYLAGCDRLFTISQPVVKHGLLTMDIIERIRAARGTTTAGIAIGMTNMRPTLPSPFSNSFSFFFIKKQPQKKEHRARTFLDRPAPN
jgi:hypothetical protein